MNLADRIESLLSRHRAVSVEQTAEEHAEWSGQNSARRGAIPRPRIARRPDPVEVAATLPILEALSRHLQDTVSDLQTSVVGISTGFGGMAARARETVQIAQTGLHSEEGLNAEETVAQIRHVLQSILSAVQESSSLSSRLSGRIEELESVLSRVNSSLRKVEKIAEEARIVGLNGRLEAARAGEHGAAFNVVANETKNLGVHAADTSSSIRKLVDQLDESLKSVSAELQARITLDADTARQSQETVSGLLNQLGLMHHGMTESLHRTEGASKELSNEIACAVMALQFEDRVSQRINHVVEAIESIYENLSPFRGQVSPELAEARAADWRRWLESRSTMKAERDVISSSGSAPVDGGSSDFGSVELF